MYVHINIYMCVCALRTFQEYYYIARTQKAAAHLPDKNINFVRCRRRAAAAALQIAKQKLWIVKSIES